MSIKQQSHGRRLGARARPYIGSFPSMKKFEDADAETHADVVLPPPVVVAVPEKQGYEPLIVYQPTEEEMAEDPVWRDVTCRVATCDQLMLARYGIIMRPHAHTLDTHSHRSSPHHRSLPPSAST